MKSTVAVELRQVQQALSFEFSALMTCDSGALDPRASLGEIVFLGSWWLSACCVL